METRAGTENRLAGMDGDWGAGLDAATEPARPAAVRGPPRDGRGTDAERLAVALGWFSVGLGLAELVAPRGVARLIGVRPTRKHLGVLRTMGLRGIAAGAGILSAPDRPGWLWNRVAGDTLDLALLGRAFGTDGVREERTAAATLAVLGVTALDVRCARALSRERDGESAADRESGIRVRKSVTVARPVEEVYAFWRDFENLPRFMRHLESVEVTGEGRSRWKAKAPAGLSVEWDAETVEDVPNRRIAWRSVEGATVSNAGSVEFRPAPVGQGTEVHVDLRYDPPGGKVTAALAKLFREEPGQQVRDDLSAFKQVMEIGEVLVSDATYRRGPHPGSPPEAATNPKEER